LVDRFGTGAGSYVSPIGTPYTMRSLPGSPVNPPTVYEVLQPLEVDAGTVAPAYGQIGLGTQYKLPASVDSLIDSYLGKK
jgi:hypothetical protein